MPRKKASHLSSLATELNVWQFISFSFISTMYSDFFIILLCLFTVEAKRAVIQTSVVYNPAKWRLEVSNMYGKVWLSATNVEPTIKKLIEINMYEESLEFLELLETEKQGAFNVRMRSILNDSINVTLETSLLHKTKRLSRKLADILMDTQGCYYDELFKIVRVQRVFRKDSRVEKTFVQKLNEEVMNCWINYRKLIESTIRLIGSKDWTTIKYLFENLDKQSFDAFAKYHYDSDPEVIESLSLSLGSSMFALYHRDLDSRSSADGELLLQEIFKIEIQEPCAKLCNLLTPIKQYYSSFTESNLAKREYYSYITRTHEKIIEFTCDITSFTYSSLRSRIWEQFSEVKMK